MDILATPLSLGVLVVLNISFENAVETFLIRPIRVLIYERCFFPKSSPKKYSFPLTRGRTPSSEESLPYELPFPALFLQKSTSLVFPPAEYTNPFSLPNLFWPSANRDPPEGSLPPPRWAIFPLLPIRRCSFKIRRDPARRSQSISQKVPFSGHLDSLDFFSPLIISTHAKPSHCYLRIFYPRRRRGSFRREGRALRV